MPTPGIRHVMAAADDKAAGRFGVGGPVVRGLDGTADGDIPPEAAPTPATRTDLERSAGRHSSFAQSCNVLMSYILFYFGIIKLPRSPVPPLLSISHLPGVTLASKCVNKIRC